jgi:hypothetical protein
MKCIIAGSRTATLQQVITALELCPFTDNITEVVSGCARGADSYGEILAEEYNIPVKKFPAEWEKYGRGAGHIRNGLMAEYSNALIAIWDGKSRGTEDMISKAKSLNLNVFIHRTDNNTL